MQDQYGQYRGPGGGYQQYTGGPQYNSGGYGGAQYSGQYNDPYGGQHGPGEGGEGDQLDFQDATQKFEKGRIAVLQQERVYIQKKTFTKWCNSFLEKVSCLYHACVLSFLTLKVLVVTIDAQWERMGDVGSAKYEPALLPPCPTISVLSYSN